MIVTVEAKKRRQRILPEQIVRQVKAAFTETPVDVVVPLALISAGGEFTLRSSHQSIAHRPRHSIASIWRRKFSTD
jgi:hypothetical protein